MRIPHLFYGVLAPSVAGLLVACASAPTQTAATSARSERAAVAASESTTAAAEGDKAHAKATFETVCSACHDPALATDLRNTRKGWEQVVDRMFGFGMSATDAQVKEIVDYLSATYPAQ